MEDLTRKFGFMDGDAFLSDSSDYMEYVQKEVESALANAGLEAPVGTTVTVHNPLRIWGSVTRNGKKVSESVLGRLAVTIWAFDWTCLRKVACW